MRRRFRLKAVICALSLKVMEQFSLEFGMLPKTAVIPRGVGCYFEETCRRKESKRRFPRRRRVPRRLPPAASCISFIAPVIFVMLVFAF
ncbi:MAG: hypothetical protein LBH37_03030 [Oscillospiraceae bacterium]|nr:hypothetical protein [Oscillospiraceae bacterium]